MGIVTKNGDKGRTCRLGGKRVNKDHICVEVCGCLDELCAFLGLGRSLIRHARTQAIIRDIQQDLFIAGAEVSAGSSNRSRLKTRIGPEHVRELDEHIRRTKSRAGISGRGFFIPGGNPQAAALDVARAAARRVERRIVTLERRGGLKNPHMLAYFNRLSDLLFLMSRSLETRSDRVRSQ
ncbi:MAG TPA: cob(I)yrinic acid a,c-diamide adenosyltransferase [Sedimentisphaerales bacterium]|nr:cob(I)yrinic acid a,c-diamide adenosyltransferase [Sedimentisphaerales bacterium]